ncbi:MAG TPA: LemA family protein, partial [Steroidobacteraceae bacterium]|nr:LemA family protein [Steroidobacteraceae bacterium]
MRVLKIAAIAAASLLLSACGYNTFQTQDEQVKSAWSEVINQYQRRADLIPNLVNTVKGFAAQEQAVLIGVTEARAKATQIKVDANDAGSLQQFQAAQGELSSALSRLMVVVEKYPELKSDQNFRDLQAQLE